MDKDRIVGSTKDIAGKVESTVCGAAGEAKTQAAAQIREGTDAAQNLYGQAKEAARQASDAAVNYAKDAYDNSGDTLREGTQAIGTKVEENPLGSLLVAGAIGLALGLIWTREPQRSPPSRTRYFD